MNEQTLLIVVIILAVGNILQTVIAHFAESRYSKMVSDLTDKVMSKSYSEYLMGKELSKDEKVTTRPRTDADEAFIEQENLEALEAKTKKLGEQLDSAVFSPVGGA